jgi:hypothetical protein
VTPRNRRPGTDDATRVRLLSGDDELAAALLPALDESSGPARRLSQAKASAMVASIVDAALKDAPARTESTAPVPRTTAPRRLAPILAVALVAAAVVGAAAAVVTTRYFTPARVREEAPPPPPHNVPAPVIPSDEPEELVIHDGTVITEPAPKPRKDRDKDKPAPEPREKIDLPPDAPAEDILQLANQRRKERAWKAADELYRRVLKQYPRSDAAVVAEVASATLHLEHLGDAPGALAGYRRALAARPAGALGEEARWGIAEAFRAVGDAKGEAFALRVFLDTHPRSAMATAAKKRLAELKP